MRQIIRDEKIGRVVRRDVEAITLSLAAVLRTRDAAKIRLECTAAAARFGFDHVGDETVALYRELSGEKENMRSGVAV